MMNLETRVKPTNSLFYNLKHTLLDISYMFRRY